MSLSAGTSTFTVKRRCKGTQPPKKGRLSVRSSMKSSVDNRQPRLTFQCATGTMANPYSIDILKRT